MQINGIVNDIRAFLGLVATSVSAFGSKLHCVIPMFLPLLSDGELLEEILACFPQPPRWQTVTLSKPTRRIPTYLSKLGCTCPRLSCGSDLWNVAAEERSPLFSWSVPCDAANSVSAHSVRWVRALVARSAGYVPHGNTRENSGNARGEGWKPYSK